MSADDLKESAPRSKATASDLRRTLDAFLLAAHRGAEATQHERAILLADIARELAISEGLAEKIATFLEAEGLVDYDDQAVDITVEGMLRAEEISRGG